MLRKLSVPLFVAFVISGCDCSDEPKPEQSVSITAPKSGATLTMKDDTANNVDGLQIAVTATIAGFGTDAKATLSVNGTAGTPIDALTTTLTFPGVTLQEGSNVLKVEVTDANGTKDAVVSVTADLAVVSCTVELIDPVPVPPDSEVVLNKSKSLAGTGMQYRAKVKTSGCLVGGIIRVCAQADGATGTGCEKAGGKVAGEAAHSTTNLTEVLVTLPEGQMQLAAEHKTAGTTPELFASAAQSVTVDTVVPTCTFVAPAEGSTLNTQNVDVQVQCTGVEVDQKVSVSSDLMAAPATGEMTADGLVTIPMVLPPGEQTLTAKVADKAGNASAPITRALTVSIEGCDIVLSAPVGGSLALNLANGNVTGTPPTGSFAFKGSSTRCPDGTLKILRTRNGTETEVATMAMTNGTFSKAVDFLDGECGGKITLKVEKAGWQANDGVSVAYATDFTPPSLLDVDPPLGNLFVVNASNPNKDQPGYVVDANPNSGGGQVNVNLAVTGIGDVCGTIAGNVRIVAGTKVVLNESNANNAAQTIAQTINLDEGISGPVNIILKDAADNVITAKWDAKVSTLPLPVLTIGLPGPGTINITRDLGGDRSTYALVQGLVNYTGALPPGSFVALCTNLPGPKTGSACTSTGFVELLGTRVPASGVSQFYSGLQLGQGSQDIIAEMADAVGSSTSSPAVRILVDTKPPKVSKIECTEDANKDGVLSGSELPIGQAAHVAVTFLDVEDGQVAVLFDGSTNIGTATVTSSAATFTVATLSDGPHTLRVAISDKAGNPNTSKSVSPEIVNPEAEYSLSVQRVAPSISRVAPSFDTCNKARDADPATPNTCDIDFTVLVGSSATRVEFTVIPSTAASITPATVTSFVAGQATARYGMSQSATPAQIIATAYDAAGNARQASFEIKAVDTIPPTISFVSPTQNQVVFSQTFPVVLSTDAEVGQVAVVKSLASNTEVGQGPVVAGSPQNTASFNVSVSGANQDLSATVSDLAGNPSVPTIVSIQMNLAGCDINFTYPTTANPVFNLANAPGGVVEIKGYSSLAGCGNKQINFTAAVDGGAATSIGSVTTDAMGNFSFSHTFGDGTQTAFTATSSVSGSSPNGFTAITDFTPPTLSITSPALTTWHITAPTDNINVRDSKAGYLPDADPMTAGGQVSLSLQQTGSGPSAGNGTGKLAITQGTVVKTTINYSDNSPHSEALLLSLDQGFTGTLTITATDFAGNAVTETRAITVDVVPPPSPSIVTSDPGTGVYTRVLNNRHADIEVVSIPQPDDGVTGQSLAWDFGYTDDATLAGTPFDSTTFDSASYTTRVTVASPPVPGIATVVPLNSIPPLTTYRIAPRVVDGIGNRSPMAPASVPILWTTTSLPFPQPSTTAAQFGLYLAIGGDIDGDGKTDFAAAAPFSTVGSVSNAGTVIVYYGGTTPFRSITYNGPTANAYMGRAMAIGDINGDSFADFLVRVENRADVYLSQGATGISNTPSFSITAGTGRIAGLRIIPDTTGDGRNEVLVTDHLVASNGKAFVFFGRATWPSTIDVAAADITITGMDASGRLGFGNGLLASDIDGDGKGDILLPAASANATYLFSGTKLGSNATMTTADATQRFSHTSGSFGIAATALPLNADSRRDLVIGAGGANSIFAFLNLSGLAFESPGTLTPWATGTSSFGTTIAAGDLNDDGQSDLVVGGGTTGPGQVTAFWSQSGTVSSTNRRALTGGAGFGNAIVVSNVTGDAMLDLLIGEPNNGNGILHIIH